MKKTIIGIDIGGTNIKMGLFSSNSIDIIDKLEYKTPLSNQKKTIIKSLEENIYKLIKNNSYDINDIEGVGVAVPCVVKNGYIFSCPNVDLDNMDFEEELGKVFPNLLVKVSNDASIAALGENESLEKPYKNAVMYTMGTGIGGGIIIDGNIYEGTNGFGGEIGHIKIHDENLELCGCGSNGCLEQICGTKGIISYTNKLGQTMDTSINLQRLNVKNIFDAAKLNDELGNIVVDRVAKYIGISAAIISTIIDPEVFIIGGGVSKAGAFLIDKITNYYKQEARFTMKNTPFILAKTGNDAGIIGSAFYIRKFRRD